MTKYLKFDTKAAKDAHLSALGFPKRGKNARTRKEAHDRKQKTIRPFPIERSGSIRIMRVDENYTSRKNAEVITKEEAQALGTFPDYIPDEDI